MKVSAIIPNYNDADKAIAVVEALLDQNIPNGTSFEAIVVDDGSTDGSEVRLRRRYGDGIRIISHSHNLGRSHARNSGAWASNSDLLLFLDADCVPENERFIESHIRGFQSSADVTFGALTTHGDDFWSRAQRMAMQQRLKRFMTGSSWILTAANFSIRSSIFRSVGGFDKQLNGYGFEDRDLFLRLIALDARFAFEKEASAIHHGSVSFASIRKKHFEAGVSNARLFRERHEAAYRSLGLSRFDACLHPVLAALEPHMTPLFESIDGTLEKWLHYNWIPLKLRIKAAQLMYGWAYLQGTRTTLLK